MSETESLVCRLAPILRGALAVPSGNDDDPWRRVILTWHPSAAAPPPPVGGQAAWQLTGLNAAAPETELRDAVRSARERYGTCPAASPDVVVVESAGYFAVEHAQPGTPTRPLEGKIAMVTGAAGAIGSAISTALLASGCRVAAADLPGAALDEFTAELQASAADRALSVAMDVTRPAAVRAAFDRLALAWGGVDIVVVNAGIALVSPLTEMDPEAFRRLEAVNVEGTLFTIAEAGRRLRAQGTGGDVILISTKNVFAPGANFGAYSATKAAAHQLARIASLEFAPDQIRVNMVAPDAVFGAGRRRSGLWAQIGPDRMRARGLDEKGLEEYYRQRNLLKARITPEHVARAVLFFATRQTPTTGATLPVDGGLPDATPR
mgnify:CR=1 FL=1